MISSNLQIFHYIWNKYMLNFHIHWYFSAHQVLNYARPNKTNKQQARCSTFSLSTNEGAKSILIQYPSILLQRSCVVPSDASLILHVYSHILIVLLKRLGMRRLHFMAATCSTGMSTVQSKIFIIPFLDC